jgi:hypothetical protein
MAVHLIEILIQGVWSSLTGGWFYDPHSSLFINTFHMYTWLFLFVLPFSFYIVSSFNLNTNRPKKNINYFSFFLTYKFLPCTYETWLVYTLVTLLLVSFIKLVNFRLNVMYDTNRIKCIDIVHKLPRLKKSSKSANKNNVTLTSTAASLNRRGLGLIQTNSNNSNSSMTNGINYPTRRYNHSRHRHRTGANQETPSSLRLLNINELELNNSTSLRKRRHSHHKRHNKSKRVDKDKDKEEMNVLLKESVECGDSIVNSPLSLSALTSKQRHVKTNENLIIVSRVLF